MKPPDSHSENVPSRSSEDTSSSNAAEWARWMSEEYRAKWRSDDPDKLERVKSFLLSRKHVSMDFTADEFVRAFASLKRPQRCDHYGVSISCLWAFFRARESAFVRCLNVQMSSADGAASWVVRAWQVLFEGSRCLFA